MYLFQFHEQIFWEVWIFISKFPSMFPNPFPGKLDIFHLLPSFSYPYANIVLRIVFAFSRTKY